MPAHDIADHGRGGRIAAATGLLERLDLACELRLEQPRKPALLGPQPCIRSFALEAAGDAVIFAQKPLDVPGHEPADVLQTVGVGGARRKPGKAESGDANEREQSHIDHRPTARGLQMAGLQRQHAMEPIIAAHAGIGGEMDFTESRPLCCGAATRCDEAGISRMRSGACAKRERRTSGAGSPRARSGNVCVCMRLQGLIPLAVPVLQRTALLRSALRPEHGSG